MTSLYVNVNFCPQRYKELLEFLYFCRQKSVMKQPRLHFYRIGEGVTAFSSTRQGGYSEGRYGEFNINRYCGDVLLQLAAAEKAIHRVSELVLENHLHTCVVEQVREAVKDEDAEILVVAAQTEADIAELETYEERQEFLKDVGLEESGVNRLIKAAYKMLQLETFITAGEMEVKAWTYRKGWKAPQCAGVIHTDFERGFIRAEVIKYDDYVRLGSEAAVREAGLLHVEGKEYVVQDGDIMHFRFNV